MDHFGFRQALLGLVPIAKGALRIGTGEGIRHAGRFLSGAMRDWSSFAQWIEWQDEFARQYHLPECSSVVARKPVDAYFGYRVDRKTRIGLLMEHYRLSSNLLMPGDLRMLWGGGAVDMGQIRGKKRSYGLSVMRSDAAATRQEGEFAFVLECGDTGLVLCRMTFLLTSVKGQAPTLAVGGLQGDSSPEAKQCVIFATRDLGGLRPKDALVLVAGAVAHAMGAQAILAISNENHVSRARRSRRLKPLPTDYDAYFTERGGVTGEPFGFIIPIRQPSATTSTRRDQAKREFWTAGRNLLMDRSVHEDPTEPVLLSTVSGGC